MPAGMILSILLSLFLQPSTTSGLAFSVPSFCNHISDVVGLGPKEKMIGVNAWRIVTFVKDFHSFGDRASFHFIRSTVSQNHPTVSSTTTNDSVSIVVRESNPNHASFFRRVSCVFFETGFEWYYLPSGLTRLGAETPASEFEVAGACVEQEFVAAVFASTNGVFVDRMTWHDGPPTRFKVLGRRASTRPSLHYTKERDKVLA